KRRRPRPASSRAGAFVRGTFNRSVGLILELLRILLDERRRVVRRPARRRIAAMQLRTHRRGEPGGARHVEVEALSLQNDLRLAGIGVRLQQQLRESGGRTRLVLVLEARRVAGPWT